MELFIVFRGNEMFWKRIVSTHNRKGTCYTEKMIIRKGKQVIGWNLNNVGPCGHFRRINN